MTIGILIVDFVDLFEEWLPETLKRLTIFEDSNDSLAAELANAQTNDPFHDFWLRNIETSRIVDPKVGAASASGSRNLEKFSVSYMVNAEDFFQACLPTWTWQNLQVLSLTSQSLRYTGDREKILALLCAAGAAALRMPKLRTLQIWNGTKGNACAFIYHWGKGGAGGAYITWRGTWDLELSPPLVEVWQRVALDSGASGLRVDKQRVEGIIGSHGEAIYRLDLPSRVVTPASLWQIRREGAIILQE
ncbi:hypothetical protein IMZ48_38350 [Candidatus Bathyarchaeota archaeon]|nr:hypothetical protein [Candidatus Bathyarchaeota archaeon]